MVLACAEGLDNKAVAKKLRCSLGMVGKWRSRFLKQRLEGLYDEPRPGAPRTVVMAVNPDGRDLRVVETGTHNGEGLAVVPDGSVWIAVNERDNVTYPFHSSYAGHADAFGQLLFF